MKSGDTLLVQVDGSAELCLFLRALGEKLYVEGPINNRSKSFELTSHGFKERKEKKRKLKK